MKRITTPNVLLIVAAILAGGSISCTRQLDKTNTILSFHLDKLPPPTEGEENEELREKFDSLRHRSAPGTDWRIIEASNMDKAAQTATAMARTGSPNSEEVFAGGLLSGEWTERGAGNQAGNIRAVDYVPATNILYTIGNGGSLWKSVLGSGAWTLMNQTTRFDGRLLKAFTKTGGGTRLLAFNSNQTLQYSDNEGSSFSPCAGISFPVGWGGNYVAEVVRLNDASNTIYALTWQWDPVPWQPRYWLYRSTDQGVSFTKIYTFDNVSDDRVISLCNPNNSNEVYALNIKATPGSGVLYTISASTVTIQNTTPLGTTGNSALTFKGCKAGAVTSLYVMLNNNTLFRSDNLGSTWTQQGGSFPENAWDRMNVSLNDPAKLCMGGVNAFRSINSGATWTKVNEWSEYYGNVSGKLHADIMWMEYFRKTDGTEFAVIDCHGGTYTSYDNLVSVSNQSVASHRVSEYYDVLTDTLNPNRIFVGAQDQGLQRTLTGTTPGIQNFSQVISGDYGHLCLTNNNNFLWPQYPGGTFYLYTNLGNVGGPGYIGSWTMPGTQKPNYGWMLPGVSTANAASNSIWLGGGNISGGGGSYLCKLTLGTTTPYAVTASQIPYDFRANSNSTTSGLTAIEQSNLDTTKMYAATEDGTFFYSSNTGTSWTKSTSFTGPTPWYLYGSTICASHITPGLVWFGGSGYSNNAVYQSVNGGVSFSPISTALPGTLVSQIVANPAETMLFAATDAGPYVYIRSQARWYSLQGAYNPVQFYSSVEYISSSNTVRFSTMGRGIWDFRISVALPLTLLDFRASLVQQTVHLQWKTTNEIRTAKFGVERSSDGIHFTSVGSVNAAGNSAVTRTYQFDDILASNDKSPLWYYRLKLEDQDGSSTYSPVRTVRRSLLANTLQLKSNPVGHTADIMYQAVSPGKLVLRLTDAGGKLWLRKELQVMAGGNNLQLDVSRLSAAVYFLEAVLGEDRRVVKVVK